MAASVCVKNCTIWKGRMHFRLTLLTMLAQLSSGSSPADIPFEIDFIPSRVVIFIICKYPKSISIDCDCCVLLPYTVGFQHFIAFTGTVRYDAYSIKARSIRL